MRLFEFQTNNKEKLRFNSNIFNFGSLRDDEIFKIVLGRNISEKNIKKAYIKGYKTVKVENQLYPTLIKDNVTITEGNLIFNLIPKDLKRINFYENGLYGTEILSVFLKNSDKEIMSNVYSIYSTKIKPLDEEWYFEEFKKEARPNYIKEVKEWMEKYND